jgi:hypothetical protein
MLLFLRFGNGIKSMLQSLLNGNQLMGGEGNYTTRLFEAIGQSTTFLPLFLMTQHISFIDCSMKYFRQ